MDLRAPLRRDRLRRRFPAALVGAQAVLTISWVMATDQACLEASWGGCSGPLSPREPTVFGLAVLAGLVAFAVALVVPSAWGRWISDRSPTVAALATADRWTTGLALLVGSVAALVIPQLFLGDLGVRGLAWLALSVPAWPTLLAVFGSLTLAVYVPPTLIDIPEVLFLTMGILFVVVVAIAQVLWYYGIASAVRAIGSRLRAVIGGGLDSGSGSGTE